jgi:hypothetical protein
VERLTELLHEYSDLFLTMFTYMKVIDEYLGKMKIPLKPEERLVRQRPYKLNPIYKKKVRVEIDRMLGEEKRRHKDMCRPKEDKWFFPT